MITLLRSILLFAIPVAAATAQTRPVNVSWTASVTSGVTGYSIAVGTASAGPFTFKACTGTVPGQTCVAGSNASTTSYADTETVGTTVWYQVTAFAAACTPTTPPTQACGGSTAATASTTVPPQPQVSSVVLVVP